MNKLALGVTDEELDRIVQTNPNGLFVLSREVPLSCSQFLQQCLGIEAEGPWPFCHPNPASKKMLAEPQFAHLNFDFRTEMSRYLRLILKAALDQPL